MGGIVLSGHDFTEINPHLKILRVLGQFLVVEVFTGQSLKINDPVITRLPNDALNSRHNFANRFVSAQTV